MGAHPHGSAPRQNAHFTVRHVCIQHIADDFFNNYGSTCFSSPLQGGNAARPFISQCRVRRVCIQVKFNVTPQLRIAHPVKLGQSCIPAVVVQQPQLAVNHGKSG